MNPNRFQHVINNNIKGIVTYIMSESFRIQYNHGLLKAIELSNQFGKGLQILLLKTPESNKSDREFFNKGILGYERFLSKHSNDVYYFEEDSKFFYQLLKRSSHIIKDKAYNKPHSVIENRISKYLEENSISFTLVESNVLVPVSFISNKEGINNKNLKTKIDEYIDQFIDLEDISSPTFFYEQEAKETLEIFLDFKLNNFVETNNTSSQEYTKLETFLKYGFISPQYIFKRVIKKQEINGKPFIDEFIISHELSLNLNYNKSIM